MNTKRKEKFKKDVQAIDLCSIFKDYKISLLKAK